MEWLLAEPGTPFDESIQNTMTRAILRGKEPGGPTLLRVAWDKWIREPVIPYDISVRKRVFAHAYEELALYVAAWREIFGDT